MSPTIDTPPRRFHLMQDRGVVAEGAVWSSGAVALHYPGHPRSTAVWGSLDDVRIANTPTTSIKFLDDEPTPTRDTIERDARGWPKFKGAAIPLPDDGTDFGWHDDPEVNR